jgi:electron transport complex protein RnfC
MSGILLFGKSDAISRPELPCISCAKCVDACPARLMPTRLSDCGEFGYLEMAEKLGAFDCIECGSCSFICPSNRRMLHYIRWAKNEIRIKRVKEKEKIAKETAAV